MSVIISDIKLTNQFKKLCAKVVKDSNTHRHYDIPETACAVSDSGLVAAIRKPAPYEYGTFYALGKLNRDGETVTWLAQGRTKTTIKTPIFEDSDSIQKEQSINFDCWNGDGVKKVIASYNL